GSAKVSAETLSKVFSATCYNLRKRSVGGQNAEEALPANRNRGLSNILLHPWSCVLTDRNESAAIPRFGIALTPDPVTKPELSPDSSSPLLIRAIELTFCQR